MQATGDSWNEDDSLVEVRSGDTVLEAIIRLLGTEYFNTITISPIDGNRSEIVFKSVD